MKVAVFWEIALFSLVVVDRLFRGAYCPHHHGDSIYQTTQCNILEGSHFQLRIYRS